MATDKRKHARVRHRDTVELTSGAYTFSGTSVNVSTGGMQVVVRMPASHDSIRSIAFQIPGSGERIEIPCRLIRNSDDPEGDRVLGLEFLYEADAQLLLIEKFIQDTQPSQEEVRQLPRTSCRLDDVTDVLDIDTRFGRIGREGVGIIAEPADGDAGLLHGFVDTPGVVGGEADHIDMRDAGVPALGFTLGPAHQLDAVVAVGGSEGGHFVEGQIRQDGAYEPEFHHRDQYATGVGNIGWLV